jgi:hypothetical protein
VLPKKNPAWRWAQRDGVVVCLSCFSGETITGYLTSFSRLFGSGFFRSGFASFRFGFNDFFSHMFDLSCCLSVCGMNGFSAASGIM